MDKLIYRKLSFDILSFFILSSIAITSIVWVIQGVNLLDIVTEKGHEFLPESLDKHCLEHIARFKRPKDYINITELPKNNYGKVLKTILRENLKQRT